MHNKEIEQWVVRTLLERYLSDLDAIELRNKFIQLYSKFSQQSHAGDDSLLEQLMLYAESLSGLKFSPGNYTMQSIFSNLFDGSGDVGYHQLDILRANETLISKHRSGKQDSLTEYLECFIEELSIVSNVTQVYCLLEKYLWCVPCSREERDISLFQYIKTVAAISTCLYYQHQANCLSFNSLSKSEEHTTNQFILISGDLSGIQKFIFNTSSRGAAKSLKGRSVYLGLLAETVVRYLLEKLELPEYNLLYNGGGNFYILAPEVKHSTFEEARKYVLETLLDVHRGELYFGMGCVPFSVEDFRDFTDLWRQASETVGRLKQRKWSEIGLEEHFDSVFGPIDSGSGEQTYCEVCGITTDQREIAPVTEEESTVMECSFCSSFKELTIDLSDAKYLCIQSASTDVTQVKTYQDVFKKFGYKINFSRFPGSKESLTFKLNDTDFLPECSGYKFGAYNLPKEDGKILSFDAMAEKACNEVGGDKKGDKKLAYLKLDVDNLGAIFINGFGKNKSIARITSLSRAFELYFGGYINHVISDNYWNNQLYVVFSGGDDTFLVGTWNSVLNFAHKLYTDFRAYTGFHPRITFSAGISIFHPKYPLAQAALLAEEALDNAKHYIAPEEHVSEKNKVSLFEEIFTWNEFEKISEIKNELVDIVRDEKNTRAILYKVLKSTLGFKKILEETTNRNLYSLKLWRLAYYLRNLKRDNAAKILKHYEDIVIRNLRSKSKEHTIGNIMIIPVSVKLAEMQTRPYKEKEDK